MADTNTKAELIAQLASARSAISHHCTCLRHDLDIPTRLKSAFTRNTGTWLGGAAVTGWLLAKIPSRKKKILVDRSTNKQVKPIKQAEKAGLLLLFVKFIFTLLKPAVVKMLTKKVASFSETLHR